MTRKAIFLVVLSCAVSCLVLAWDDCPFGLANDPHPGKCGLYEDVNSDSICDHSQKNPSLLAPAQDTIISFSNTVTMSPEQLKQVSTRATKGTKNPSPMPVASIITEAVGSDIPAPVPAPRPSSPLRQRYPLWQVFLVVLVLAAATEILIKRDKRLTMPLQTAWNWALGLSFLLTLASSLVFVFPALLTRINFNMSYWHSLAGLAMIAAGLYHMIRRFGWMWRGVSAGRRTRGAGHR